MPNGIDLREISGGTVAATVHRGPYDEIGPAYHTLAGWLQENDRVVTGLPCEMYLNDPQTVPPDDLLTESHHLST